MPTSSRLLRWVTRVVLSLVLSASVPGSGFAQVCTQPITLRTTACPLGATTCTTKGSTLTFADMDSNLINIDNLCNNSVAKTTYNVRDTVYAGGAKGDGATDDRAAIQAALTAAGNAGGGLVKIPASPSSYLVSSTLTVPANVWVEGDGQGATTVRINSATLDLFRLGAYTGAGGYTCGGVRDMQLASSVPRTAGDIIGVDGCADGDLSHLLFNIASSSTGGNSIDITANGHTVSYLFVHNIVILQGGSGSAILIKGPGGNYLRDINMTGDGTNGTGITVNNSGGDFWMEVEIDHFGIGVLVNPGTGQLVENENMVHVQTDSNNQYGFQYAPSGAGVIQQMSCQNCWAATNGVASANGRGIYILGGSKYTFSNPQVGNNGGNGIEIAGGSYIDIENGWSCGNSQASSGTKDGIAVSNSSGNFRIINNDAQQCGNYGNTQRYGISISSAIGNDNYTVSNNDVTTNLTGGVLNSPGLASTRIVTANRGATMDSYSGIGTCSANTVNTGNNGAAAPTCTSLTGAYLPNPSASTLGGVESLAPVTSKWINTISTSGVPGATQPAFTDISGTASDGQLANGYSGAGSCTNQVVTALTRNAAPTCTTLTSAFMPLTLFASGADTITVDATSETAMTITNDDASANGPRLFFVKSRSGGSASVNDITGSVFGSFLNSASTRKTAGNMFDTLTSVTSGSESATKNFNVMGGSGTPGAVGTMLSLAGGTSPIATLIGHIVSAASASNPSVACTGTGTSPPVPTIAGTDSAFVITMNTGTAPSSSGTCTVTFAHAYVTNAPVMACMLVSGASGWGSTANLLLTTESVSAPVLSWDNSIAGVLGALTGSSSYKMSCLAIGR
jgi:hypothetical protein